VKAALTVLAIAFWPSSLVAGGPPLQCQAAMRDALIEGHFSGVMICSREDVSLVLVGRTAGSDFSIYDYRYRFLPHPGGVYHGGQRLLVFHGDKYVGQYVLQPLVTVTVHGTRVVLRGEEDRDNVELDFSGKPPNRILVNGEREEFGP